MNFLVLIMLIMLSDFKPSKIYLLNKIIRLSFVQQSDIPF